MRVIDVTASSKELAIEKGLQMLGTTEENVDIVVLEKGSMLKKAKVELTFFENEQEKLEFYEEREEKAKKANELKNIKFNEQEKVELIERKELTEIEETVKNRLVEFVQKICDLSNIECEINGKILNDNLYIIVDGKNTGRLIGHHGDNLQALHTLINNIVRNDYKEYGKKVFIDIEGYRERRKETVESLAKRMAKKVLKEKRSLKLEPMNSYERKVIHSILSNIEHISTHSEGVEPNRYLIIDYVDWKREWWCKVLHKKFKNSHYLKMREFFIF